MKVHTQEQSRLTGAESVLTDLTVLARFLLLSMT